MGAGMDFEPSDYRIPGGNAVTLSSALAKEIKDRFFRDRDNRFHIYLLAAGLRRTYLQTSEGGKDSYTPEFRGWYAENKLERLRIIPILTPTILDRRYPRVIE